MKKILVSMMIGALLMMAPVMAIGASFTGTIQGFNCVTQGKICPIGMEDPIIAAENVFVLLVDMKKGEWYFVPNVDRGILARHINTEVRIVGDVDVKMKAIKASEIYSRAADRSWKLSWSTEFQDKVWQDLYGGMGGRGSLTGP